MGAYKYRSLASQFAVVAAGVSVQQRRHFRTALTGLNLVREVRAAVGAVLDGGTTLMKKGTLDDVSEMVRRGILDEQRRPGRFDVQLELELARRFTLRTDQMARRCLELARLTLSASPSQPVQKFLSRVGRCYVTGLLPESVIMCRAVLEQALIDKFQRGNKPPPSGNNKSEIGARLERAEELGWITRRQRKDAWEVHLRGNKAIHQDPELTTDVLGTITTTIGVLNALYAGA